VIDTTWVCGAESVGPAVDYQTALLTAVTPAPLGPGHHHRLVLTRTSQLRLPTITQPPLPDLQVWVRDLLYFPSVNLMDFQRIGMDIMPHPYHQ